MRLQIVTMLCGAALLPFAARAQQPPTSLFCSSIGVKVGPMTAAVADSLGMTERYGAVFRRPRSGGPAAMAGIEAFDVVTAINGAPAEELERFRNNDFGNGAWRDGQSHDLPQQTID